MGILIQATRTLEKKSVTAEKAIPCANLPLDVVPIGRLCIRSDNDVPPGTGNAVAHIDGVGQRRIIGYERDCLRSFRYASELHSRIQIRRAPLAHALHRIPEQAL